MYLNAVFTIGIATEQATMLTPYSTDGVQIFNGLHGITTDGTNIYVTDSSTIKMIESGTGRVTTLAGKTDIYDSTDGSGAVAGFDFPWGITTDGKNLFVTECSNNTIRQIQ